MFVVSLQSAKVYKRHSSVIPSSHILNEVEEVQPGTDRTEVSVVDVLNGIQVPSSEDAQKSSSVFGSSSTSSTAPKVQLRTQRTRHVSRPISMPLERLPTPAQISDRNNRYATDASSVELDPVSETIQELPEIEKTRQSSSSRVSTYYITPFMDTQTLQRRTWDKKYKHYDVTPRTAMIVANLPSPYSGAQPVFVSSAVTTWSALPTSTTVSTVFSNTMRAKPTWTSKEENGTANSVRESRSSSNLPLMLRQPRTLQPPPGTFYKPPPSITSRARMFPNWTTTVTTTTTTSSVSPAKASELISISPPLTSPPQTRLQTQDSTDSAIDPGVSTSSTLSPPLSPAPSSPEDLSPSEIKPVYQRLRSRQLQELEQREAHFV